MTPGEAKGKLPLQFLKSLLSYDENTGIFTAITSAYNRKAGDKCGAITHAGYLVINIKGIRYIAHRLAWFYMTGRWPKGTIDHINGNPNDNRFCNLRDVNRAVNSRNLKKFRDGSVIPGVRFDPVKQKWKAIINIGTFQSQNDAAAVFGKAREILIREGVLSI